MRRRPRAKMHISQRLSMESLEPRVVLAGQAVISEFAASNDGLLLDEDGASSDWIELANIGDEPVDLEGWYLTDDTDDLDKWQLPQVSLAPGEQRIVFASGKDRTDTAGELHTNFRLAVEGEPLALVAADGQTIVSRFSPEYPRQFRNISYGVSQVGVATDLLTPQTPARLLVPTAEDAAVIGDTWTGGDTTFDDTQWTATTSAVGYRLSPFLPQNGVPGTVAYQTPQRAQGSQAVSGPLGMDFVVTEPVVIYTLGAFDDGSNGFNRTIAVELWGRDDQGTPDYFRDDTGTGVAAAMLFTPDDAGVLVGGTRFKALPQPILLPPGAYTISARGYGLGERNAVGPEGTGFGSVADSSAVQFVGQSRYGVDQRFFPGFADVGPANRYGAGSFTFEPFEGGTTPAPVPAGDVVAYRTLPGTGNATTTDNVGLEFVVDRPIRVTELGVFDSGQDGIAGAVGVSIWSRDTGTRLAEATFIGDRGRIEPGTGSRFLELAEPVILPPGFYSVVASGFLGNDRLSRADGAHPRTGTMHDDQGAISFVGSSSTTAFEANRFFEEPHHRLTEFGDVGPVNKFAAGTFKYDTVFDDWIETDVLPAMFAVNSTAYLRMPINVPEGPAFDALLLHVNYDDGFVAYLNGVEVARRNAPDNLTFEAAATTSLGDSVTNAGETIDLTDHAGLLNTSGNNVLAVQLLNDNVFSVDAAFSARLEGVRLGSASIGYFTTPTPGAPNGNALFGFVETPVIGTPGGLVAATDLADDGTLPVELRTMTPDAAIYYTTDGSVPTPANGTLYTGPIAVDRTLTLRTAAFKDQFVPSATATTSYLLLDEIVGLSGTPDGFPSHWNGAPADYGMTQDPAELAAIAGDPGLTVDEALEVIKSSLMSLPTMSIVLDGDDLFGTAEGIYTNPFPRGRATERPASIEYYTPAGERGFQIDGAMRMMGWTSRIPFVSPKHSLRLLFREEYGAGRLNYPLFPDSENDSFDTLALRNNSRDTWISDYPFGPDPPFGAMRSMATYIRDQWSKTVLSDMGQVSPSGNFVHLYLNGVYWGVYNPTERPDGAFASDLFGGQEDDYDALTFCNPTTRAAHGDLGMWNTMIDLSDPGLASDAAFQRLLGNNPDGTRNPEFPRLLDPDNFIDYIIAGQYDATDDWPCNFYAIRERADDADPFQFITWDNDLALPNGDVNASRMDIDMTGTPVSSPWRFQAVLEQNAEYRLQFADRAHRHLFNDGALTPSAAIARWTELGQQVRPALVAEAARWGDYRRDVDFAGPATLYTPSDHWDPFNDFMTDVYFPQRTDVYLQQLRDRGLYPQLDAAVFNQHGGDVTAGFSLAIAAPAGTVYYTTDGSDPREPVTNVSLVAGDAANRILVPSAANGGSQLGLSWTGGDAAFNDSGWFPSSGGIGYELDGFGTFTPFFNTDVSGPMVDQSSSAYVRIPFQLDATTLNEFTFMDLKMRYDDGFVAYLNGVRVAAANAPETPAWNSAASGLHDDRAAMLYENFDVSAFLSALREGENVLAIHALNAGVASSDFLMTTELVAGGSRAGLLSPRAIEYTEPLTLDASAHIKARVFDGTEWSALNEAAFNVDTGLRVSEIHYNPAGDDATEFIELTNTASVPADLLGVHFADGIVFEFLPNESKLVLEPGESIVVTSNPRAFAAAYPDVSPEFVADNPYGGQLSNGGERLVLADAGGGVTQEFTYSDAWYPETDGDGKSLTIVDATADRSQWNLASGWQASSDDGGSPGTSEPAAAPSVPGPGFALPDVVLVPVVIGAGGRIELPGAAAAGAVPQDAALADWADDDLPAAGLGQDAPAEFAWDPASLVTLAGNRRQRPLAIVVEGLEVVASPVKPAVWQDLRDRALAEQPPTAGP